MWKNTTRQALDHAILEFDRDQKGWRYGQLAKGICTTLNLWIIRSDGKCMEAICRTSNSNPDSRHSEADNDASADIS
ncbi:MAG: hypothetical protein VCB59_04865, partial [Gammaproteobacteria bacterium]